MADPLQYALGFNTRPTLMADGHRHDEFGQYQYRFRSPTVLNEVADTMIFTRLCYAT